MSSQVTITIMSGPRDGEQYRFPLPKHSQSLEIQMGRRENCDIPMPYDGQISRLHAKIIYEKGEFWLVDQDSRNGTHIGAETVRGRRPISPGSMFRLGRTWLRLDPVNLDDSDIYPPGIDDIPF